MKITKVVGNQRQIVDLDVRNPASFARALTTKNVVSTSVSTINTTAEQSLIVKTIQTCVRPFAIAIVQEKK
jgi:hypothetical protein